jgi:Acetyltransferase (isoleucine patch superfamily)
MNKKIYALGIGNNTPVFIDLALDCGYEIAGFYHYNDDKTGQEHYGYKVLGSFADLFRQKIHNMQFLLTMGDIATRRQLSEKLTDGGGVIPTLVHPTVVISRYADISANGVLINAHTHVQAITTIDEGVVVLSGVVINHNNHIDKFSFIADKALVGAYTHIGENVFFGQAATSISHKVKLIGNGAYVGAGSLLTKDVPENAVVCGQPARIVKYFEVTNL